MGILERKDIKDYRPGLWNLGPAFCKPCSTDCGLSLVLSFPFTLFTLPLLPFSLLPFYPFFFYSLPLFSFSFPLTLLPFTLPLSFLYLHSHTLTHSFFPSPSLLPLIHSFSIIPFLFLIYFSFI